MLNPIINKMTTNPPVGLFNAPEFVGNYIIKNKLVCEDVVDVMVAIVGMKEDYAFLFNSDQLYTVISAVLAFVQLKRKYVIDCVNTSETRDKSKKYLAHLAVELIGNRIRDQSL